MAKSKLDFNNPLLSSAAAGTGKEEREPTEKKRKGAKRNPDIIRNEWGGQSSQEGLTSEYTRFSVICKVENVKAVRDYAYTERIPIRRAMDEIIESFFASYKGELLDHTEGETNK